ncbi:MAG: serine/threonine protein kinase, partial [Myxococcota bacterium]|nr:serine/threonine protein kinase [Myxococcota bacterium]
MKALGTGGMAELLLARTAPTERPVVLKWVRPEHAIDSEFLETFLTEGRRAAQLEHPNIVQVREVGREDGTYYLTSEYVHGDDVRKLLARLHERRAKLPVQHIISIITAVAAAIHHAHEQVIEGGTLLHLDIKPANVIIAVDGTVKVTDFGIARAALLEGRSDLLGSIAGYMSPEQVTGEPIDRRTDVFGIGILMYELATGRRLFKGDNDFVTMSAIVGGDIPPPTRNRGDLPKELELIIMKALARAPESRYQTVLELQGAIDSFAAKAGVRGSLTTLSGYTKRLFGVRPEPWLVDDEHTDFSSIGDFDGSPRGLATPPVQASHSALPDSVNATSSSPIHRIMKQVSREMPTEQLTLAKLAGSSTAADKSVPVKIPAAAANGRVKAPTRAPAPAP